MFDFHQAGVVDEFYTPDYVFHSPGEPDTEKTIAMITELTLRILDGKDVDLTACDDRTPLQDLGSTGRKQHEWLQKNGLLYKTTP